MEFGEKWSYGFIKLQDSSQSNGKENTKEKNDQQFIQGDNNNGVFFATLDKIHLSGLSG